MPIIRNIQNKIGSFNGYGSCSKCGDTWDKTEYQVIPYDRKIKSNYPVDFQSWGRGMFPLCKKCFNSNDEEQILQHCILLLNKWKTLEQTEIIENLKYNISLLKRG